MKSTDELSQYISRAGSLSQRELRLLARSQAPEAWANAYWDWGLKEEHALGFAQLTVRMMRSLDENDAYELAASLSSIFAMVVNWIEGIEDITLAVFGEFCNKKADALSAFHHMVLKLDETRPDVSHAPMHHVTPVCQSARSLGASQYRPRTPVSLRSFLLAMLRPCRLRCWLRLGVKGPARKQGTRSAGPGYAPGIGEARAPQGRVCGRRAQFWRRQRGLAPLTPLRPWPSWHKCDQNVQTCRNNAQMYILVAFVPLSTAAISHTRKRHKKTVGE